MKTNLENRWAIGIEIGDRPSGDHCGNRKADREGAMTPLFEDDEKSRHEQKRLRGIEREPCQWKLLQHRSDDENHDQGQKNGAETLPEGPVYDDAHSLGLAMTPMSKLPSVRQGSPPPLRPSRVL